MQKVSDYTLVVNGAPDSQAAVLLAADVKQHMEDGWVPSGTVVVFNSMLVQAMVKFEEA